jgi:hypothetical protein
MTHSYSIRPPAGKISRRELIVDGLAAVAIGTAGALVRQYYLDRSRKAKVFIAKAASYEADLVAPILAGLHGLGIGPRQVQGKRILLKPNFVETMPGTVHICTRPEVIFAAVEAFRKLGAAAVLIGEGSGHCRDTDRVLEEAGMTEALVENKTPFVDLNNDDLVVRPNAGFAGAEPAATVQAAHRVWMSPPPSNHGQASDVHLTTLTLRGGDVVVMVSDGITATDDEQSEGWLPHMLSESGGSRASELAARILEAATAKGGCRDDMTVLVLRLGEVPVP